ncbi:MAG TPA: response regulator [Dongiaceae bacterium]|nr:response regulator [Dongiaceae bacterium]
MNPETDPMPLISILLVEDDNDTLEILAAIIPVKFPDVALHTAVNGKTGLELFKTHLPDIVVTDINMPEIGGVQMVGRIRAIKPDAKIIVITADTGKATLEDAVGEGFEIDHYIMKPIDFGVLFAAIEQCLGKIAQRPEIFFSDDGDYSKKRRTAFHAQTDSDCRR